jgi:hypothetical protein
MDAKHYPMWAARLGRAADVARVVLVVVAAVVLLVAACLQALADRAAARDVVPGPVPAANARR